MNPEETVIRHVLATLAYRGARVLAGAPPEMGEQRVTPESRTAREILAHIGDVLEWGVSMAEGREAWNPRSGLDWPTQVERYFAALQALDAAALAGLRCPWQRLFQGPLADPLTHLGQLATLRRLAGSPVPAENYSRAEIETGRLGLDQAPPRWPMDRPGEEMPASGS